MEISSQIAPRDFVNLRHWERRATGYLSCNVAVAFDGMPPTEGCVRYALIVVQPPRISRPLGIWTSPIPLLMVQSDFKKCW